MEMIFQQKFFVSDLEVDCFGKLKLSSLLFYVQEVAGRHCLQLGTDYDTLAKRRLFWAVTRHRVQVSRLPRRGETITVQTWPMPTTRVAYPRSVFAYDSQGNELFRCISLWVLMDLDSRAMVLPGKSGVEVNGIVQGNELELPHSLASQSLCNSCVHTVTYSCLDRNGHMNNTKYLDWVEDILSSGFHKDHSAQEFVICYLNEARENQQITLDWTLTEDGCLQVHAHREKTDVSGKQERVFSAQILF